MEMLEVKKRVLDVVKQLEESGIKAVVEPSRSRTVESTVDKYAGKDDHLPVKEWDRVTFYFTTNEEYQRIRESARALSAEGIGFDTGGCKGQRDWELDWSLMWFGDHLKCGRGTPGDGPDAPDCSCRGGDKQSACAEAGCGFCRAASSTSSIDDLKIKWAPMLRGMDESRVGLAAVLMENQAKHMRQKMTGPHPVEGRGDHSGGHSFPTSVMMFIFPVIRRFCENTIMVDVTEPRPAMGPVVLVPTSAGNDSGLAELRCFNQETARFIVKDGLSVEEERILLADLTDHIRGTIERSMFSIMMSSAHNRDKTIKIEEPATIGDLLKEGGTYDWAVMNMEGIGHVQRLSGFQPSKDLNDVLMSICPEIVGIVGETKIIADPRFPPNKILKGNRGDKDFSPFAWCPYRLIEEVSKSLQLAVDGHCTVTSRTGKKVMDHDGFVLIEHVELKV